MSIECKLIKKIKGDNLKENGQKNKNWNMYY